MFLTVNKFLNKNIINIFFTLVFLNYFLYFLFKEKLFFIFFGILIVGVFLFILLKHFPKNKLLISVLILLCFISLSSPVSDWDGRSIWLFNAKIIFYIDNLNNYFSYSPYYSKPDYSIFVPVLSATIAKLSGVWNEILPKISHFILAVPPIILLTKNFNKKISLFIFIILILFVYEKRIINGENDVLLSLYSISLIYLLSKLVNNKYHLLSDYTLILFHVLFLTLLKMEGLALAFCILLSFYIINLKRNKNLSLKLFFIFILGYIPIFLWILYTKYAGAAGGGIEISSVQKMMSGGERFFENLFNFKFILYLISKIIINKQMLISLIIFIFVLSKYIYFNENKKELTLQNNLLKNNMLFCYLSIVSYTFVMMTIMIMLEGTPNDTQIQFWQATVASNRYFLPVHSMLILCAINLIESKKN